MADFGAWKAKIRKLGAMYIVVYAFICIDTYTKKSRPVVFVHTNAYIYTIHALIALYPYLQSQREELTAAGRAMIGSKEAILDFSGLTCLLSMENTSKWGERDSCAPKMPYSVYITQPNFNQVLYYCMMLYLYYGDCDAFVI